MVLILCPLVFTSLAQSKELSDPQPYFSAIIVADMDTSLDWYTKNFGFEVLSNVDMSDRGFRQANLTRGSALIELIELSSALPQKELLANQPARSRIQGFFKFGFTVADLDSWIDFLEKGEVDFNGSVVEDPNTGKRMIIVLDPDGNRIQLFEE